MHFLDGAGHHPQLERPDLLAEVLITIQYKFHQKYTFSTIKKKDDIYTISLIGTPNVGKSQLFNRLQTDDTKAIVDKTQGLTRDRKEQITHILGYPIRVVDTAGLEDIPKDKFTGELREKMMNQTLQALLLSDLAVFMVDVRNGISKLDEEIGFWLKKNMKKKEEIDIKDLLFVANKFDDENLLEKTNFLNEVYKLGLGEPIYISALNGNYIPDFLREIDNKISDEYKKKYIEKKEKRKQKLNDIKNQEKQEIQNLNQNNQLGISLEEWEKEFDQINSKIEDESDLDEESSSKNINICFIGRTNAGKSTLINKIIGEERVITHDQSGTTRDSIKVEYIYREKKLTLIDTAGIDQKISKVSDVEKKCQKQTIKSIKNSHIVVCMIDSLRAFQVQDLSLVQYVCDQGKAVILCVNKWDLVPEEYKKKAVRFMQKQLEKNLGQVKGVNLMCFSAEKEDDCAEKIFQTSFQIFERWNLRISTGMLNDWLGKFKKVQNLPTDGKGESLKIRFFAQVKSRPPTFVLFVNNKMLIKNNYLRFMRNKLAEEFQLEGVPIRILIREGERVQDADGKKYSEKYVQFKKRKLMVKKVKRKAKLAKVYLDSFSNQKK
ncbi:hypothetical protein IMG5_182690 [Ichthyophthirius multifiliis]|uniref:GTPase Der n=1 Tax=Ichthyophthirius multifiliis TaxID=5932 RepID=G0R326_ICHMU|nr:hypothetical protein IMG5_182690 [Ichthyophthirius multifiliis]EGR28132.1 hypothetical protein IMG5_182690 [Ichthyophthirius multifiliis]|eukprot:XP_004027477.1 hypothetical protein IMG5_182690 [Ichthyophthirius multifiliis]